MREVDEAFVEIVNERLTNIWQSKAKDTVETLGRCILQSFYGGSVDVYRRVGAQHESMKALARLPHLGMPRRQVWDCLRYVEQFDAMPRDVAGALTVSHHRALYRVRDPRVKLRLARVVLRRKLTVEELRGSVTATLGPDERGRGRPRKSRLEKLVDGLGKATADLAAEPLTARELAGLSPRQVTKLKRELQRQVMVVARLAAQLDELAGG